MAGSCGSADIKCIPTVEDGLQEEEVSLEVIELERTHSTEDIYEEIQDVIEEVIYDADSNLMGSSEIEQLRKKIADLEENSSLKKQFSLSQAQYLHISEILGRLFLQGIVKRLTTGRISISNWTCEDISFSYYL